MLNLTSTVGKYKIITQMKGGTQGFVYLVENIQTHEKNVLKSMCIEESKKGDFEKMIQIWMLLCKSKARDFIVKFKEHFYDGINSILIMEYCVGGDLDTLIKKKFAEGNKFTEDEIIKVVVDGMTALQEIHFYNLIHRDVKSANILIGSNGKYQMSDFNTSKILEGSSGASTMTGSLEYAAPEIVKSEEYSYSVDVYSFGIVLYQMMVGKTPFINPRGVNLVNVAMGKYEPISASLGYSQTLVDLVRLCMSVDASVRPTPAQILAMPLIAKAVENTALKDSLMQAVVIEVEARTAVMAGENAVLMEKAKKAEQEVEEMKEAMRKMEERMRNVEEKNKEVEEMKEAMRKMEERMRNVEEKNNALTSSNATKATLVTKFPIVFGPRTCPAGVVYEGSKLIFSNAKPFTISIEQDLAVGKIYVLDLTVAGNIYFGLALKSAFPGLHSTYIYSRNGTCMLVRSAIYTGTETACSFDSLWPLSSTDALTPIRLELNQAAHTLHFFISGKQLGHCVTEIPSDVYFAISRFGGSGQVDIASVQCVAAATTDTAVMCTPHTWR